MPTGCPRGLRLKAHHEEAFVALGACAPYDGPDFPGLGYAWGTTAQPRILGFDREKRRAHAGLCAPGGRLSARPDTLQKDHSGHSVDCHTPGGTLCRDG